MNTNFKNQKTKEPAGIAGGRQTVSGNDFFSAELKYLNGFAASNTIETETEAEQFRSLWTAFCLHQNIDVDTSEYDSCLRHLWEFIQDETELWSDFNQFDMFMCKLLV